MGQKVNPKGYRLGIIFNWNSIWYADKKNFKVYLKQDILTRKFIMKELKDAGVEKVIIERPSGEIVINIYSARPGVIIGRAGSGVEELKRKIKKNFIHGKETMNINIKEVERPALSSSLVAQGIIADLEKRIPFRRTVKQAMSKVQRAGALGVKVIVGGRLNGAEIARSEMISVGKVPLHTIRADIDYTRGVARTMYGAIGVKVWIYKGEVFIKKT